MAENYYPDVQLGPKTDTALPDLQLPVYRGDNAGADGQVQMTPQKRKVMAYLQALRAKRMQQEQGAQMPQGGQMAPQGMAPPQIMPPQY